MSKRKEDSDSSRSSKRNKVDAPKVVSCSEVDPENCSGCRPFYTAERLSEFVKFMQQANEKLSTMRKRWTNIHIEIYSKIRAALSTSFVQDEDVIDKVKNLSEQFNFNHDSDRYHDQIKQYFSKWDTDKKLNFVDLVVEIQDFNIAEKELNEATMKQFCNDNQTVGQVINIVDKPQLCKFQSGTDTLRIMLKELLERYENEYDWYKARLA